MVVLRRTQVNIDGEETVFMPPIGSHPHKEGICPLCGKKIDFIGAYELDDDGATLNWQCPSCGASGEAGYTFVFDQYYYIQDGSGNMVE